jgi:carbonic anhydrase/acetyltransferase-like protein (isoleucine patch superfamily)
VIRGLGDREPVIESRGSFIAHNATVIGDVRVGPEASVWFNCVLRADQDRIEIGRRSNVQDASVLHVDPGFPLTIGNNVTIGHKVMLHGCTLEDDVLIGIGSTILNGARIPSHCVVGANALVTENKTFPAGSLILGSPAKVVRELTDDEIRGIRRSADHYVENSRRFLEAGFGDIDPPA